MRRVRLTPAADQADPRPAVIGPPPVCAEPVVSETSPGRQDAPGSVPASYWRRGGCAEYALALQERWPALRFGRHVERYPDEADDDGYLPQATNHVFCHDDRHAYDSDGRHELPFEDPDPSAWAGDAANVASEYDIARADIEAEWELEPEMLASARALIARSDPARS